MGSWLDAARHYLSLDEGKRHEYWLGLDSKQQIALSEALDSLKSISDSKLPATDTKPQRAGKRGVKSFLATGCIGFALGVLLTVGIQISLVASGIGAVKDLITNSLEPPVYEPLQCNPPRNAEERQACSDQYAAEALQDLIRRRQQGLP